MAYPLPSSALQMVTPPPSCESILGSLWTPCGENRGPFSTLRDALWLPKASPPPFHLLFVCGSFSQYLPIPNTPITRTHEVPVHGGFRSGELQGCLSGLSKSSPASPFLCGHQPSGQRYFPECPHCTTGGIAPQFCFLSEIQRHRGLRGWEGASRKVLGHWCPGAPLLCSQWHGLSITL